MKFFCISLLAIFTVDAAIDESRIKVFKWRGPPMIDETIFTNPKSFDYDFDEDIMKSADTNDIYDQVVRQLPAFQVFRKGHDEGYTKVPIVTRKGNTWSTLADTSGPKDFFATSPMPVEPTFVSTMSPTTTTRAPISVPNNRMSHMTVPNRFQRPQNFARQPAPAFKAPDPSNHGPIWRKGGNILFRHDATSTTTTTQRPTLPPQQIFRHTQNFRRPMNPPERQTFNNHARIISSTFHRDPPRVQVTQPKPVIIQRGNEPHRGPTYNCRVLNPYVDGTPSFDHDPDCKMLYPGLSLDGSCKCLYTVSGRDQYGCAIGYNYSCKPN